MLDKERISGADGCLIPKLPIQNHILVVEDDKATQTMLEAILISEGYLVTTAEDAEKGFKLLTEREKYPFAMVITDCQMPPGKNGVEMLRATRDYEESLGFSHIPAILATAAPEDLKGVELDKFTSLISKSAGIFPLINLVATRLAGTNDTEKLPNRTKITSAIS